MDTSGIASDTMLGASIMKEALQVQARTTTQLLNSVQPPASSSQMASSPAPDPTSRLGQNIDVKA